MIWSKFIVIQCKNYIYELRVEFVITHDVEPVKWALQKIRISSHYCTNPLKVLISITCISSKWSLLFYTAVYDVLFIPKYLLIANNKQMNYDLLNSLNKTKNCNILQNIASIYSTCHAWSRWYSSERIKLEQLNYQGTFYKWKMNVIVDITLELQF